MIKKIRQKNGQKKKPATKTKMQRELDKQHKLEAQELRAQEKQAKSPKKLRRGQELVKKVEDVAEVFGS